MGTLCSSLENPDLVQEEENHSSSITHSRKTECPSRPIVKVTPGHSNRVVTSPSNFQRYNENLGNPTDRSICHSYEQEITPVCVSVPGSNGLESRCNDNQLGKSAFLCISPNQTPSTSYSKDKDRNLSRNNNSSKLAKTKLVCKSSKHKSGRSHKTSSSEKAVKTAPSQCVPSTSSISEPPCLESKLSQLEKQGFSKKVAERISKNQRNSTLNLYHSRWARFLEWTGMEEDDIDKITIPQIADFLTFLFEEKQFSTSTIDGYKSAIGNILKYSGLNVLESQELKDLLSLSL